MAVFSDAASDGLADADDRWWWEDLADKMQLRRDVSAFYWDLTLKVPEIAELFSLTEHELRSTVYPQRSGYKCNRCGQSLYALSRAHLLEIVAASKPKRRRYQPDPCRACAAKEKQRREQEWKEGAAARAEAEQRRKEHAEALATMPYTEYLLTEEWQERRRGALKRAGYRCQLCNAAERLDVHHRTYERRGSEWNADLIVLCRPCHAKFHDKEVAA